MIKFRFSSIFLKYVFWNLIVEGLVKGFNHENIRIWLLLKFFHWYFWRGIIKYYKHYIIVCYLILLPWWCSLDNTWDCGSHSPGSNPGQGIIIFRD